jgi:hypothetical protein
VQPTESRKVDESPGRIGSPLSPLYRSEATEPFGESDLYDVADGARERNRRRRITGALFYESGKLFQWLEGPRKTVNELFEKIGRDPRHFDVRERDRWQGAQSAMPGRVQWDVVRSRVVF